MTLQAAMTEQQFLDALTAVFRRKSFRFDLSMTSADVPGWDSLRHVVLIMELNERAGIELSPETTAALPDLRALHQAVLDAQRAG